MIDARLYAIVFRMTAIRRGAIPANHGDQARAAMFDLLKRGNLPFTTHLHDENGHKPYTISLVHGGKRGVDGARHFGEGDLAEWRFTILSDSTFEAVLRRYILDRNLPHVRIGAVEFAITDAFASNGSHPLSGFVSIAALQERWNCTPDSLPKSLTLDFLSPTAFSKGQDKTSGTYHYISLPLPRILFSTLRKRWLNLGGSAPGDEFDIWVDSTLNLEPIRLEMLPTVVERRTVPAFIGRARFTHHGDPRWLGVAHLLADFTFWAGVGYQTTRGMGQAQRVLEEREQRHA